MLVSGVLALTIKCAGKDARGVFWGTRRADNSYLSPMFTAKHAEYSGSLDCKLEAFLSSKKHAILAEGDLLTTSEGPAPKRISCIF